MFDLYVFPILFRDQKENSTVSGFYIGSSARKVDRTRETDRILYKFSPNRPLNQVEDDALQQLLEKSASAFFRSHGALTTAIRKGVELLNNQLIKYNQGKKVSQIVSGTLQLAIVHEDEVYFAHIGTGYSFVIRANDASLYYEKSSGNQGLGISTAVKTAFFRSEISHGDRIVLCNLPPSGWTASSLTEGSKITISHLRKVLLNNANRDFEAIIVQVRNGSGEVHQLKLDRNSSGQTTDQFKGDEAEIQESELALKPASLEDKPKTEIGQNITEVEPKDEVEAEISAISAIQDLPMEEIPPPVPPSVSNDKQKDDLAQVRQAIEFDSQKQQNDPASGGFQTSTEISAGIQSIDNTYQKSLVNDDSVLEQKQKREASSRVIKQHLVLWMTSIKNFLVRLTAKTESINSTVSENTAKLISRTNPASNKSSNALSLTSMFFMAILVPILVVAVATTVYLRSGRGEQHQKFVVQANALVVQADSEIDGVKKLIVLQDALLFLDEAEKYGKTDASNELRAIIQQQLDVLQGVTRIPLQNTIAGGLDRRIQITRMVVSSNEDVYALDQVTGRVLRLIATRPNYEVDTTFECGPGRYEQTVVHELVDIELIAYSNSKNAAIIGIDRAGNLLLCSPAASATAISLKVPEMGWGQIQAIGFNGYSLYILDIDERTRDLYRIPAEGLTFTANPESIFNGNIPDNLSSMEDIALYENELYVLNHSGLLMDCSIGDVQIICNPNIGYGVIQSGHDRQTSDVIAGAEFTQLQTTQPPDPSLFFMDQLNNSVYHFSLALNMQKQIEPDFLGLSSAPEGNLSAFTISPYGVVHFAFGHQLYFGYIP